MAKFRWLEVFGNVRFLMQILKISQKIEKGKFFFFVRSCSTSHPIDGSSLVAISSFYLMQIIFEGSHFDQNFKNLENK